MYRNGGNKEVNKIYIPKERPSGYSSEALTFMNCIKASKVCQFQCTAHQGSIFI